ncbi:MAG: hypothetical protein KF894_01485 [Labilithrix sp.]|nr:hypothetical protein [Labilithrix sp.]
MSDVQGRPSLMPDREAWSFRAKATSIADSGGRELVIIAPPGSSHESAFAALRRALRAPTRPTRLIGHGVTMQRHQPAWLAGPLPVPVTLTELDAYLPCERTPMLADAEDAFRAWLDKTFEGSLKSDLATDRVFWASAMRRVFAPWFYALPLARGIAHHHESDEIVCLDSTWPGASTLESLVDVAGGRFRGRRRARLHPPWVLHVGAHTGANLLAAFAVRSLEFLREARSRRHLASRQAEQPEATPDVWIGLIGEWPRTCRHIVESVGSAVREHDRTLGVLLHGSFSPGSAQVDVDASRGPFPALDHPLVQDRLVALEQCVAIERAPELVRHLSETTIATMRVGWRLARSSPRLSLGPIAVDLRRELRGLSRLATFDLMRAREAEVATTALLRRRDFRGSRIVWPHASVANVVVPDLMLQRAGGETLDLVHGALAEPMDFVTHARTHSSSSVWWTESEVGYVRPYIGRQRAVGGYVPRALSRCSPQSRTTSSNRPLRVLVVSNYATPTLALAGAFSRECYQDALLDAVREATSALPVVVRWRPHPYDDRSRVDLSLRGWSGTAPLELSSNPDGLQAELGWADAVVASVSSSIVEALLHPVALFVHDIPLHERDVLMSMFDVRRRFSNAAELTTRFAAFVAAREARDSRQLEPEQFLRRAVFGETGRPRDLATLLWDEPRPNLLGSDRPGA